MFATFVTRSLRFELNDYFVVLRFEADGLQPINERDVDKLRGFVVGTALVQQTGRAPNRGAIHCVWAAVGGVGRGISVHFRHVMARDPKNKNIQDGCSNFRHKMTRGPRT